MVVQYHFDCPLSLPLSVQATKDDCHFKRNWEINNLSMEVYGFYFKLNVHVYGAVVLCCFTKIYLTETYKK